MRQIIKKDNLISQQSGGSNIINLNAKNSTFLKGFKVPTLQLGGSIRSGTEIRTYNNGQQTGGSVRSGTEIRPVTNIHKGGSRKQKVHKKTKRNGKKSQHKRKMTNKRK